MNQDIHTFNLFAKKRNITAERIPTNKENRKEEGNSKKCRTYRKLE